jgi:hypothetical protein
MANAIYPLYKQSILSADSNVSMNQNTTTDGPYCALVTASYTYSASDQYYSSLSGVSGTDQRIANPTVTTGLFDGDDLTYTSVAAGSAITALVIYRKNSGANTTWRLFAYIDTGVTGLPVTPNGGNISVTWNASGIVQL